MWHGITFLYSYMYYTYGLTVITHWQSMNDASDEFSACSDEMRAILSKLTFRVTASVTPRATEPRPIVGKVFCRTKRDHLVTSLPTWLMKMRRGRMTNIVLPLGVMLGRRGSWLQNNGRRGRTQISGERQAISTVRGVSKRKPEKCQGIPDSPNTKWSLWIRPWHRTRGQRELRWRITRMF